MQRAGAAKYSRAFIQKKYSELSNGNRLSNLIDRQTLPTNMSQVADPMVNAAMSAKEVEILIAVPSPLY